MNQAVIPRTVCRANGRQRLSACVSHTPWSTYGVEYAHFGEESGFERVTIQHEGEAACYEAGNYGKAKSS
jgi:hypothetical protein